MKRSPHEFFERVRMRALEDDYQVWWSRTAPPSEAEIVEAEKKLGLPLCAEHRELAALFGCGAILVHEDIWPRPGEFEVRPLWQFQYGFEIFGVDPGGRAPLLDIIVQSRERSPGGRKKFVAAARRIGSPEVVGYDSKGKLHTWSRSEGPKALDLSSLLEILFDWLVTLEFDKERMKTERQASRARAKPSTKTAKAATKGTSGKGRR
jgi:hypothetical protein